MANNFEEMSRLALGHESSHAREYKDTGPSHRVKRATGGGIDMPSEKSAVETKPFMRGYKSRSSEDRGYRGCGTSMFNRNAKLKEGGEARTERGMGGGILSALANLLPFKDGGNVDKKSSGGEMREKRGMGGPMMKEAIINKLARASKEGAFSKGGEAREEHGMGGNIVSALASLLPFSKGGEAREKAKHGKRIDCR